MYSYLVRLVAFFLPSPIYLYVRYMVIQPAARHISQHGTQKSQIVGEEVYHL